jgi:hypothetical protein
VERKKENKQIEEAQDVKNKNAKSQATISPNPNPSMLLGQGRQS